MNDNKREDSRSDLEQIVEARSDAVKAGEGGDGASPLAPSGVPDGVGGTAGEVKNQGADQQ
jgi:hypothetical protein